MSTPADDSTNGPLDEMIAEYLRSVDRGEPIDRSAFLAAHPDQAAALNSFFNDFDAMVDLGQGEAADEHSTHSLKPPASHWQRVRYFGDYELLEEIARGGMGVVFKARQVSLNRVVALKMIQAGRIAATEDLRRFRVEAEAAAQLDHPNILPIHEVGVHEGQHYFTMKLIEGGNLANWITTNRNASDKIFAGRAVKILTVVARAVHFAHQRGILHRDLKPANILLDANATPFVADFGLAKNTELPAGLTATGAILGTPNYMPPEQARPGRPLTTAVDVYALGAIVYEMLTGRPPFNGPTFFDVVLQVLDHEPPAPRSINPQADRDLSIIALKCLQKDPAKRYESAAELAEELDRWQNGEPIKARAISSSERVMKWVRRRPGAAAAILLGILAVAAIYGTAFYLTDQVKKEQVVLNEEREVLRGQQSRLAEQHLAISFTAGRKDLLEAEAHLRNGDLSSTWFSLKSVPKELRQWEWRHLACRAEGSLLTIFQHRFPVARVIVSSDGTRILSGDEEGSVYFWNVDTGNVIWTYHAKLDVSLTGDRLLPEWKPTEDKQKSFPPKPRREQWVQSISFQVRCLALSRDSTRAAVMLSNDAIVVLDATNGAPLKLIHSGFGNVVSVAFDNNGVLIVVQRDRNRHEALTRNSSESDHERRSLKLSREEGVTHVNLDGQVNHVRDGVFSNDYSHFGCLAGEKLFVCKVDSGQQVIKSVGASSIRSIVFEPDGQHVTGFGPNCIPTSWCTNDGKQQLRNRFPFGIANGSFSPDGLLILNYDHAVINAWDGRRQLRSFAGHAAKVNAIAFAPTGTWFASCSDDQTVRTWNLRGEPAKTTVDCAALGITALEYSPDGKWMALGCSDGTLRVWNAETYNVLFSLVGHEGPITCVAFSPNSSQIASGGRDRSILIWDRSTGNVTQRLRAHHGNITALVFTHDGRRLISSDNDCENQSLSVKFKSAFLNSIQTWDLATGVSHAPFKSPNGEWGGVESLAISSDGNSLVGIFDQIPTMWDIASGNVSQKWTRYFNSQRTTGEAPMVGHFTLRGPNPRMEWHNVTQLAHPFCHRLIAFRPHQSEMISLATRGSKGPSYLYMFPMTNPAPSSAIDLKDLNVSCMAFTKDGTRLATGEDVGTIRLWDLQHRVNVATYRGHEGRVNCLSFGPDDSRLVSVGNHDKLVIWEASLASSEPGSQIPFRSQRPPTQNGNALNQTNGDSIAGTGLFRFPVAMQSELLASSIERRDPFATAFHYRWLTASLPVPMIPGAPLGLFSIP